MLEFPKKINVKLTLYNEDYSFGNGLYRLLLLIDEYKSVNRACKEMRMAYSKAYKMIIRSEKDLNCKLLVGKIGGKGGGGSELTPEARELLTIYERVNLKTKEFAENEIIPVASPAVEGINQQDKEIKYVSVAKLIGILPPNVAQRYRKLESEAIKLKSDAMNCDDVNTQSVVLRKIASYIRVIGVYRNQYKNDEAFQSLAIALEDQMYDIRNALSDRNFFRERATRLYGVARADFNY